MLFETLEDNPLWYKDGVIYQARVRSFYDSDGDGIGDFRGMMQKLDFLQDLGVTVLWLLPFYPSPLRDDGYDISDYASIHSECGTLADFRAFLREAHRRGLRVITELVINHTSDQHPWFQRSRRAKPGTWQREFYVWSDTPDRYKETRIIFQDFEPSNWSWDPVAKAYYWHRFYSHQPDLNFDSPAVRKAVFQAMDFWLGMGVDGLRLDAVPYLYEREGTNCENLPETHMFLRSLRARVDARYRSRMLLAEANQWPEDAVAYFGQGDECHMAFHFPIMPRLFMAVHMEDRYPILDILRQTPPIPDVCQWALFLRNHDELTLEMVTDEERDYMYRTYAADPQARINLGIRRRLAPLLGNDRKKIELMNSLLFSLPGTPIVYYGDEIGMGDNFFLGDRNGVRTPMQWSGDRNAGFSRANPQRLILPVITDPEYHYETVNVEVQQNNPHSLLWWMKRLVALQRSFKAFGRGSLEILHPSNRKVLVFVRAHESERILVVANLSRYVQYVELDLSAYKGMVPLELFGRNKFPPIGELPYFLTLGPHSFYWFLLTPQEAPEVAVDAPARAVPHLEVRGEWDRSVLGKGRAVLEAELPGYLRERRWFAGKARQIKSAIIQDAFAISHDSTVSYLTTVEVEYGEGPEETYILPLSFAPAEEADAVAEQFPGAVVAHLTARGEKRVAEGVLYDALSDKSFCQAMLSVISRRRRLRGGNGEICPVPTAGARNFLQQGEAQAPRVMSSEQSNTSISFGDKLILKIFRRAEEGLNPDVEVGRFLTERTSFRNIAPVAAHLEYRRGRREALSFGILQGYVPNQGDAWQFTRDEVGKFFERVLSRHRGDDPAAAALSRSVVELAGEAEPPDLVKDTVGAYMEQARLLGQRTGEFHIALASDAEDPDFAPEPFTRLYQRSLYQSMRNLTRQTLRFSRDVLVSFPEGEREIAQRVLNAEEVILCHFDALRERRIDALRTRTHGDYHLGQVLTTGNDFVIIDFEGEPARPLSERRQKRSPLRDVAGMLRSFHYAVFGPLLQEDHGRTVRPEDVPALEPWAELWHLWVSASFLRAYLKAVEGSGLLPDAEDDLALLLRVHLLEKAVYELGYELNNRPGWIRIPVRGIFNLIGAEQI